MLDLKPIKARLAMAHDALWNNTSTVAGDRPVHLQISVARTGAFGQSAHLTAEQRGKIADLLLNAPQDIAALIDEIERLQQANAEKQRAIMNHYDASMRGPAQAKVATKALWELCGAI